MTVAGRPVLIDRNGVILGGGVPRTWQGKRFSDLPWCPHGVIPSGAVVEAQTATGDTHYVAVSDRIPRVGEWVSIVPGADVAALVQEELETLLAELDMIPHTPNVLVPDDTGRGYRRMAGGVGRILPWWRPGLSRERVARAVRHRGLWPSGTRDYLERVAIERLYHGRWSPADGEKPPRIARITGIIDAQEAACARG